MPERQNLLKEKGNLEKSKIIENCKINKIASNSKYNSLNEMNLIYPFPRNCKMIFNSKFIWQYNINSQHYSQHDMELKIFAHNNNDNSAFFFLFHYFHFALQPFFLL